MLFYFFSIVSNVPAVLKMSGGTPVWNVKNPGKKKPGFIKFNFLLLKNSFLSIEIFRTIGYITNS